jgi:hypothetical protein
MTGDVTEWIDADGGSTTLDVEWNVQGRGMPPMAFEEDRVPERPGSRLRAVRHGARDMTLNVWITAATSAALRTLLRSLIPKFDATRGDGRIRVTSELGDQREITCRYAGGLELAENLGSTSALQLQRAPIAFRAFAPYWTDVSDTTVTYTTGTPATFFPFFPLRLSSSEVFAQGTVTNGGDVQTWPVWTITGPGSAIVLRNQTSGKLLSLTITLGSSETLVIDTREGVKTVTKNDGSNLFSALSATSSLWPLLRGVNAVQVEMSGGTAATQVGLAYRPRYLTV